MGSINGPMGVGAAVALVSAQLAPLPALAPAALAALAIAPASAQSGTRTQMVTCYSLGDRANSCRLPEDTVSVRYMGPDRSGRCREGDTWRQAGNVLQVQRGCGGNFEAVVRSGGWGSSGGNWGGSGGGWGGSNGQGFAGELTCRSLENREENCRVNTEGRVMMLQQLSNSACVEGRSWRSTRNTITVRDGCQARFGYGYGGNSGGGWGGSGGSGGSWGGGGQGFAGQLECRSENNRYRRCNANTENRVELLRQFSSSACVRGRSWGFDRGSIWVDNGCQARFGYGFGNVRGDTAGDGGSNTGGSNTGAVIGGVALAAGLVALLAAAGKGNSRSAAAQQAAASAARVDADLSQFPADARAPAQACLNEAARQVGATGGTAIRLDRVEGATRSGEGWMILARLAATWPDHGQQMAMDCRATGTTVTAFDVR